MVLNDIIVVTIMLGVLGVSVESVQIQTELCSKQKDTCAEVCRKIDSKKWFDFGNYEDSQQIVLRAISRINNGCNNMLFVDVGANVGDDGMMASEIPKICKERFNAHLFEPNLDNFDRLAKVVANDNRLTAVFAAVGEKVGRMPIYGQPVSGDQRNTLAEVTPATRGSAEEYNYPYAMVHVDSLDHYAETNFPNKTLDFLKVDVEGFERSVFLGAMNLIKSRHVPIVMYECHGAFNQDQWPYPANIQFFKDLGYDHWIVHNSQLYRIDTPFFEDGKWQPVGEEHWEEDNCLAIHRHWPSYRNFLEQMHTMSMQATPLEIFDIQTKFGDSVRECQPCRQD